MRNTKIINKTGIVNKANIVKKAGLVKTGKRGYRRVLSAVSAAVCSAGFPMLCYAAGTESVIQPLENLKTLVIAVIGAIGIIILAKNVMEFAQAYQQQDSSTMSSALKGIVAGVMMAGISAVLSFLGF